MKTKKSNAKKLLSLLLVLLLAMSLLAGCGSQNDSGDDSQETVENKVSAIVNVAALNGPTGMGMVKLMDLTDKYAVTTYQAPTDIAPKLINGEVDVAALPSNMAAVLYNKTEGQIDSPTRVTASRERSWRSARLRWVCSICSEITWRSPRSAISQVRPLWPAVRAVRRNMCCKKCSNTQDLKWVKT